MIVHFSKSLTCNTINDNLCVKNQTFFKIFVVRATKIRWLVKASKLTHWFCSVTKSNVLLLCIILCQIKFVT